MLFKNKRKFFGHQAGENSSNQKGAGIELADLSIYNFGDDAKYIDWLASARSGHIYVKNFVEDKSLDILVLCDRAGSMIEKKDIQNKIIKILNIESKKNGDKIKFFSYKNDIHSGIQDFGENYFSDLDFALQKILEKKIKRHIIVILSDDFCQIETLKKINLHNQIFFINLFSQNDIKPQKVFGNFFSSKNNFSLIAFWQRASFEKKINQKIQDFGDKCKKNKISYSYFVENNYTLKQIYNFFSS